MLDMWSKDDQDWELTFDGGPGGQGWSLSNQTLTDDLWSWTVSRSLNDDLNSDTKFVCGSKKTPSKLLFEWFGNTESTDMSKKYDKDGEFIAYLSPKCQVEWWDLEDRPVKLNGVFLILSVATLILSAII